MATTKITNPELFDLGSLDSALQLPSGTTAERPTSPSTGEWRFNTDNNLIEFWDGSAWFELQDEDIPPIPSENFSAITYTGTVASTSTSTQSITGLGFQPDVVWIKQRSSTAWHHLTDSSRGGTPNKSVLFTNVTNVEGTGTQNYGGVVSYDSDGFTLQGGPLGSNNVCELGSTYVAWCWKVNGGTTVTNTEGSANSTVQVNQKTGSSIIQYSASGSDLTYGHGLSQEPNFILVKARTWTSAWFAWHKESGGAQYGGYFDQTSAVSAGNSQVGTPNATTIGANHPGTRNSGDYIVYAFHDVAGYSKFGTYTGNGSANGPVINTGFQPAMVIMRVANGASGYSWYIIDNKRDPSNPVKHILYPNDNVAEVTSNWVNFLTNGFQVITTSGGANLNGATIIYMAFAADPSTAPVLADSFSTNTYTGNGGTLSIQGLGLQPNWLFTKRRDSAGSWVNFDSVRGASEYNFLNLTSASGTGTNYLLSFDDDGFTVGNNTAVNTNGASYSAWAWKASIMPTIDSTGVITVIRCTNAAAGFSIIEATSPNPASNTDTVGHGLGAKPDLIIGKRLDAAADWSVILSDDIFGSYKYLSLNLSSAMSNANNLFTDTTFQIQNATPGRKFVFYAFKAIAGYSKISTYTGNGSAGHAITGLGFQPDYVLIKGVTSADNWFIFDSVRGDSVALNPNLSAAEYADTGVTSFDSDGFTLGSGAGENRNGDTYLYAAFKINQAARDLDFLVIAGGAAGGVDDRGAGGGGAGGFRTSYGTASGGGSTPESGLVLTAGTYTITVGAGGAGVTGHPQISNNGSDSSIVHTSASLISTGGGAGGWGNSASGSNYGGFDGGSGGGGAHGATSDSNKSSGITGQGYGGGKGLDSGVDFCGGGGGGASAVGSDGTASSGGNGGNGLAATISGSSITYAGGGGGGAQGAPAGSGGTGGGGAGSVNKNDATDGTTNTGSGGGGRGSTGSAPYSGYSGSGGSGIVVLRMPTASYSGTTTGSPTVTTDGSDTILTYTGSGTYVHS